MHCPSASSYILFWAVYCLKQFLVLLAEATCSRRAAVISCVDRWETLAVVSVALNGQDQCSARC